VVEHKEKGSGRERKMKVEGNVEGK